MSSCRLGDLAGPDAARTDPHLSGLTVNINAHTLEIGHPTPSVMVVCMAYVVSCNRSLFTYFTYFRHLYTPLAFLYFLCKSSAAPNLLCYRPAHVTTSIQRETHALHLRRWGSMNYYFPFKGITEVVCNEYGELLQNTFAYNTCAGLMQPRFMNTFNVVKPVGCSLND